MDSYERFARVLDFETPDRIVAWSNPFTDVRLYRELGGSGSAEQVIPRAHRRLGVDVTRDGTRRFPVEDKKVWWKNRFGLLICEKPFKRESVPGVWTTWLKETPFKELSDLNDIELRAVPEDEIVERCAVSCAKTRKAYERQGIVYVPAFGSLLNRTSQLLGWQLFSRSQHLARRALGRILDKVVAGNLATAKGYIEGGVDTAILYGDDLGDKVSLMCSPTFLREEWVPRIKKIIEFAHKRQVKIFLHSHGAIHKFVSDIVKMGFDGLHPIEPTAGMSLSWMKENYGDHLVLLGNVDSCYLLTQGTAEEVERVTVECIRSAAAGSGYCLCSSGPLTNVPTANAISMYKTGRKHGKYPLNPTHNSPLELH